MRRMFQTTSKEPRESLARAERIGQQSDILGESPLWEDRAQCLYWVDIRRPAIRRLRWSAGEVDTWAMPDLMGSIALTDEGRLLVATTRQISLFDPVDGTLAPFVEPPPQPGDHRFNDGRCDTQGRYWVGSMHNITRAPEGVLYRLEGAGPMVAVRDGICIPNSLAFSPDGRTMYFADSLRHTLRLPAGATAISFRSAAFSASISRRRRIVLIRAISRFALIISLGASSRSVSL